MKKILLFAVLALPACTHAQNTGIKLPSPVRVLPGPPSVGSGKRTEILLPDENNVNPLIINHQAAGAFASIDASFTNTILDIFGSTSGDGRILLQPGSVSTKNSVDIQAAGVVFSGPTLRILDSRADQGIDVKLNGTSYLKLDSSTFTNVPHFTTPDHYEFSGGPLEPQDIFPLFNNSYDNGAALARWRNFFTQNADVSVSATFSFLGGGGSRVVCASNTGVISAGGCGGSGTVTSIGTSSPITGGTITTTGTIGCATCFTTNTGQTATATKNFFPSSGSITTSFATITLSDKTTPVAGSGWNFQATLDANNDYIIMSDSVATQWLSVFKKVGGVTLTRGVFNGDWIPLVASTYDLGLFTDPWHALFLSGAGITVGGLAGITGGTCTHWTGGICTAP